MTTAPISRHGDHVAVITLSRPKSLNAFNSELKTDLLSSLYQISADATVRVAIITGKGRAFSAGADLRDDGGGVNVEDMLNTQYQSILTVIRTCPKPVIAAINGVAAGIGMTLALSCDLRVMSENAYLMSVFSNISLVPDGGLSLLLAQEIGYARAYEAAIESQKLTPSLCQSWGLINRVAPENETLEEALRWGDELSKRAPIALSLTKRTMRAAVQSRVNEASTFEAQMQRIATETEDYTEGVDAVLNKREPNFKNR